MRGKVQATTTKLQKLADTCLPDHARSWTDSISLNRLTQSLMTLADGGFFLHLRMNETSRLGHGLGHGLGLKKELDQEDCLMWRKHCVQQVGKFGQAFESFVVVMAHSLAPFPTY